jgi:hypothetical protein
VQRDKDVAQAEYEKNTAKKVTEGRAPRAGRLLARV